MSYLDNAKMILKNQEKYNYVIVYKRKAGLLSKSNSKKQAKIELVNRLNEKCKNPLKLDNAIVLRLKIRKVTSKEKKDHRESNFLSLIGGTLVIIIEEIKIKITNLKLKLIKQSKSRVFINKSFLKNNTYIDESILKKIGYAYQRRTYGHLFSIDTITSVLKSLK